MTNASIKRIAQVIPTLEFEPAKWLKVEYSHLLGTPEWPQFWLAQLKALGVEPLLPGSWQIPLNQLSSSSLLERVVVQALEGCGIEGFPDEDGDSAGDDDDRVGAMLGGYALFSDDGHCITEPGCCCDLGDLEYWERCAVLKDGEDAGAGPGHGEMLISREAELLRVDQPSSDPEKATDTVFLKHQDLQPLLVSAKSEVLQFRERIIEAAASVVSVERGAVIGEHLVGLTSDGKPLWAV